MEEEGKVSESALEGMAPTPQVGNLAIVGPKSH